MSSSGTNPIQVKQGEYKVSSERDAVFTSVLGSCISACIHDPFLKIGGMNHFLLPSDSSSSSDMMLGSYLMEVLLNDLYKNGSKKERLEVKLFGGAKVTDLNIDPGQKNVNFIQEFVSKENLNVVSMSLRGDLGRKIEFSPSSGKTRQKFVRDVVPEKPVVKPAPPVSASNDLEFF